jgi:solute carrier family 24 (sodium/potassium/calcium exchanger), member 6
MHERWIVLGTGLAGLITGVFVAFFADKGDHRGWLLVRCSMGFFVAIVWIMAIADEIINVLQVSGVRMTVEF